MYQIMALVTVGNDGCTVHTAQSGDNVHVVWPLCICGYFSVA
jgi:hypothetical protein